MMLLSTADWNKIGETIFSLYEKMELCHSEYNIEDFIKDLEFEKLNKNLEIQRAPEGMFEWNLWIRRVFESRRSILTKLFSFTNNKNGVDVLIEYCDYYKSCYGDSRTNNIPVKLPENLEFILRSVFMMLAKNQPTKRVFDDVRNLIFGEKRYALLPYECGFSSKLCAMVIMADADLNAVVQALAQSVDGYFKVSRILVQEPIKEELLNIIKNHKFDFGISNLYVFRNTAEALGCLNNDNKFHGISVWSENIIAAKRFSSNVDSDTIWINAHGAIAAGLYSLVSQIVDTLKSPTFESMKNEEDFSETTAIAISKTYNLFFEGKWQIPVNEKYTNLAGVAFAQATEIDVKKCVESAQKAFKLWRSKKLSQRTKIIRCFADRLRANGESEYADIIIRLVDRPLEFGRSFSVVRDGEAEILTTPEPLGIVGIISDDPKMLFAKLIIAVVTGNSVIVFSNGKSSFSFAPYCDFLGTCGFPPGVISCLFGTKSCLPRNIHNFVDRLLPESSEDEFQKIGNLYPDGTGQNIIYNNTFIAVTKPKSIWLQCG